MAIEGPLRELGVHDVFQLLDLSRKTGVLTITSAMRANQGQVYFDRGAVIFAAQRNNPRPLGELLLRAAKVTRADLARAMTVQEREVRARALGEILVAQGAIAQRDLDAMVRFQVEEIVFELLSWQEGYFSFEERPVEDAPAEATVRIATESLLMEAARRIDEWSRIERVVPNALVVPRLAPVRADHPAHLDLLPNEWEVLAEIDGVRDLRTIARHLTRSEFDVARILYGLVTTGVVEVQPPRDAAPHDLRSAEVAGLVARAAEALRSGDAERASAAAQQAVVAAPRLPDARLLLARALSRRGLVGDALAELRVAAELDPLNAAVHRALGWTAARHGALGEAVAAWERYLRAAPTAAEAAPVRAALEAATRLGTLLAEHGDV
jgi:tetratricopeptide (TPR) repeat protein